MRASLFLDATMIMKVGAQILLLHASGKQLTAAPQTKTGF